MHLVFRMQAAFRFWVIAPAANALIFARLNFAGARGTSYGWIALIYQRMARQAIFFHIGGDILRRPMRQRINFYFVLISIVFKKIQLFAGSILKSFAVGYPSAKTIQSLLQNLRFAQVATPIGVGKSQSPIGIFTGDTLP